MEIPQLVAQQRLYFNTDQTRDVNKRRDALKLLRKNIRKHEKDITRALAEDLGKPAGEAYMTEIGMALANLRYFIGNVRRLAADQKATTPITLQPAKSRIVAEPYGCCLIIAPWNYPFLLALDPLIAAVAAGNCAVVKPSEMAPATSQVIATLVAETFPPEWVTVCQGGIDVSEALLQERFDYIFYTGSPRVGKIVMQHAAEHLTPVTLELGGKSPCIIDETADLDLAMRRTLFGKVINAGQTCVAPDYLLVHRSLRERLVEAFEKAFAQLLGDKPLESRHYCRIINRRHFDRLTAYLQDGKVLAGGDIRTDTLTITPTLLEIGNREASVMQEEIFGPILPVIFYEHLSEVYDYVRSHEKPLALYLFSTNSDTIGYVMHNLPFGGGCINDTLMHVATRHLPFGGIGNSGMGQYHGKWGFDTFTHPKSVVIKAQAGDFAFRYPPYSWKKLRLIKFFLR
ncbi:MAG: aldehyde dehydrogenase [Paludibacteraceae bacterium]|nr:aldehyde dehydrogenase [Paludibacteraceae bacterium]